MDDVYRSDSKYRVSKGTALGLLAKVYATWAGYPIKDESKWEDAANTAKIVVESGKHHLLNDYEQLWKNTCNNTWDAEESLLEVSFYTATITGNDPIGRIGKWNGVTASDGAGDFIRIAANWKAMPTFAKDWKDAEPGDKRWALSIADYKYTADGKVALGTYTPTGSSTKQDLTLEIAVDENAKADWRKPFNNTLCPAKWDLAKYVEKQLADANYSNVNWYLLRYSDVLLLYAEALNELGLDAQAAPLVSKVRERVGLGEVDYLTGDELRQAIRKERNLELAGEFHHLFDIRRWIDTNGKPVVANLMGPDGKFVKWNTNEETADPDEFANQREQSDEGINFDINRDMLWPIPLIEIERSHGAIVQNPGW